VKNTTTKEKVAKKLDEVVKEACEQWAHLKDRLAETESLRLYYAQPDKRTRVGRLQIAPSPPRHKAWKLASAVPIGGSWSRKQLEIFVYETMIRLPILRGPIR